MRLLGSGRNERKYRVLRIVEVRNADDREKTVCIMAEVIARCTNKARALEFAKIARHTVAVYGTLFIDSTELPVCGNGEVFQ